jgi:phenylalanyl-tRNA synthetase beta chain
MRVPLSWLRDFAPFDLDPVELGEVFDDLGMVVEGVERIGEGLDGVVVARLLSIAPIEGLDRVRMTTVDPGDGSALEVACGAWNIEPGQLVPLATIGTTLPNGMTIGRRKLKKVYSNGMLCSAIELGLGDESAGIMVLADDVAPVGTPLADALGIESDVVYDLAIEGNRPDANCVAGVARDAAARLRLPFTLPSVDVARSGPPVESLTSVVNEAPDLCPRFTATVVRSISIGPSPAWLQRRLTLAGMRPINNIVDASNYVMLELGQPTHAYDLDRLPGHGLLVRRARAGEVVRTLDGVDRRVGDGDDCLICDAEGTPVGIGGVMGGESSEIADDTRNVVLEAAAFDPMAIAWTSKRLGLRTEASARFERGVDVEGIDLSVERFCSLIATGEVAPGTIDDRSGVRARPAIRLRTARVNALLGASLADEAVAGYLTPIGFSVTPVGGGGEHDVVPPSFRPDVTIEVDLVEEVARHHGYSRIERTVPHSPFVGSLTPYQRDRRLVRDVLVGAGVSEAQTPSLLGPGDHARAGLSSVVEIVAADAMIQEESLLRASLLPGLLRSLSFNAARRSPEVAFFEIGNVWSRAGAEGSELPVETERLAVAVAAVGIDATAAVRVWHELVAGLRLAGVTMEASAAEGLHPGRTASLAAAADGGGGGGVALGVVGEVDPDVLAAWEVPGRVAYLDVDLRALLVDAPRQPIEQRPVSRFPSADIDLAFVVPDDVAALAVETAIRGSVGTDLLSDVRLFDVYRGDRVPSGTRSLAYRLRFNAADRTLTDDDLATARTAAITAVERLTPARIRT